MSTAFLKNGDPRKWGRLHLTSGCSPVSEGCDNCTGRFEHRSRHRLGVKLFPKRFNDGLVENWSQLEVGQRERDIIFVSPYGDLFHEAVSDDFLREAAQYFMSHGWTRFILLTKRAERMRDWARRARDCGELGRNVCLAVSVENADYFDRIDLLRETPAACRAVFFQPLLGSVSGVNLDLIDWVVCGGEDGLAARKMDALWAAEISSGADAARAAFYFMGLGSRLMEDFTGLDGGKKRRQSGLGDIDYLRGYRPDLLAEHPYFFRREMPQWTVSRETAGEV